MAGSASIATSIRKWFVQNGSGGRRAEVTDVVGGLRLGAAQGRNGVWSGYSRSEGGWGSISSQSRDAAHRGQVAAPLGTN